MWHKVRGAKNWMTAMAVLFAVMATIVLLRELALWGLDFVAWDFVNNEITNEKFVIVMFGIATVLFAFGVKKSEEFYR